jgi:hypothetical protein
MSAIDREVQTERACRFSPGNGMQPPILDLQGGAWANRSVTHKGLRGQDTERRRAACLLKGLMRKSHRRWANKIIMSFSQPSGFAGNDSQETIRRTQSLRGALEPLGAQPRLDHLGPGGWQKRRWRRRKSAAPPPAATGDEEAHAMATQATTDAQAERHEIQLAQPTWALAKVLVALLAASTLWSTQHAKWKVPEMAPSAGAMPLRDW